MNGLLMEREGVGWRITRPWVYIRTLGRTVAHVGGQIQQFVGNGAGQHQLRRQLGLAVGCCGRPVNWQALRSAAGWQQRPEPPVNPFYMVKGLVQMLRRWGMGEALVTSRNQLTLLRHPAWGTDTDELAALIAAAEDCLRAGDTTSAIAALELAVPHCGDEHGHRYLAELLDVLPPTDPLHGRAASWSGVQRGALHSLARLCLAEDTRERCIQALDVARLALDIDGVSRADYDLAADAAEACGQLQVAAMYRRQGDGL
jgi:hypothetical protein